MNFAEEQDQLECKILLGKLEIRVEWRNQSNGKIEAPNSSKNGQSDEWDEVQNDSIEGVRVFDENHVEDQKHCDVGDGHLEDQESQEIELLSVIKPQS